MEREQGESWQTPYFEDKILYRHEILHLILTWFCVCAKSHVDMKFYRFTMIKCGYHINQVINDHDLASSRPLHNAQLIFQPMEIFIITSISFVCAKSHVTLKESVCLFGMIIFEENKISPPHEILCHRITWINTNCMERE